MDVSERSVSGVVMAELSYFVCGLSCLRATASAAREAAPLRLVGQDAGHPASRREEARAAATSVRGDSTRR